MSAQHTVNHSFDLHGSMRVLQLLQALCEGHNLQVQNFLREQKGSKHRNVNLVAATVDFLFEMHQMISADNIRLATQVSAVVVRWGDGWDGGLCSGPSSLMVMS